MTPHQADASTAYEYKIIRSATGAFKNPAKFKAALEEEARAGWELFEKLDGSRARLRRPTSCRTKDPELNQDPYRTTIGVGQGTFVGLIILVMLVGIGAVFAVPFIIMALVK